MSTIDHEKAFSHLVGLIKHLNDNLHKWLALHFSIQAALIVAIATLIEWATKNVNPISPWIFFVFGLFGIFLSLLVCHILYRNRCWLEKYIQKAIEIEGENPYIWEKCGGIPGPNLITTITFAHIFVALGWLVFIIVFCVCGS